MNVERVFSVKGFGTVVTGIPTSGEIEVGAKACLLPAGRPAMVRTVQTYKQESSKAIANCCTAINVREIEAEQAARGMTLAWPDVYEPTQELVVTLENATGGPARGEAIELPRRFDAKFHAGTSAVDASVKLLESETLSSNTTCFAHLMLAEPVVLAAGDRFILRQLSPARTLGGGTVLSTQPQRFRRRESIGPRLQHAQASVREGDLATCQLLASPHALATQAQMERWTQAVPGPAAQAALAEAQHAGKAVNLEGGAWIALARVHEIQDRLARVLERYHATHRMTWGMEPAHVCAALDISVKNFAKLAELLCAAETMALRHGFLSLATFKPDITERQMRLRSQLLACLTAAGVSAPARGNLLKDLAIPEPDLRALEKLLLQEGAIVILDGNLMARDVFDRCRDILLKLFAQQPLVELATFRDATGTNRKMAVAMLDAFDATGLTRRSGAGRILAKPHRVTP